MSLVTYDASSDEETDYECNEASKFIMPRTFEVKATQLPQSGNVVRNGHISDEDDEDFIPYVEENRNDPISSLSKLFPKPKNGKNLADSLENCAKPTFSALPAPKTVDRQVDVEEDDEFLQKKPNEGIIEKPSKSNELKKITVKITIPSLKNFQDVEKELANKAKTKSNFNYCRSSGTSGLLSILPKAKSEQNFAKGTGISIEDNKIYSEATEIKPAVTCFVPDAVKHRRPATNTEDVDRIKPTKQKLNQINRPIQNKKVDSDESDDNEGTGDFFSFNTDQSLPEVSATEINALVAKKTEKMEQATKNYLMTDAQRSNNVEEMEIDAQQMDSSRKRYHPEQQLNSEAIQALVGGNTKRRRQQKSEIQVIDINSSQVLPNKEEWMRTALASSTTYQPTGILVDEEPASGTRRKHQITYLAHKAKANEAELQAMWSANRQNRRATQSKYGF